MMFKRIVIMSIYSPGEYGSIYDVETGEIVSAADICDRLNDLESVLQIKMLELERAKDQAEFFNREVEGHFARIVKLEDEILKWKLASGLTGPGGDADVVTPEAAKDYWESIERTANERDAAMNNFLACGQELRLVKRQLRNMTRAINESKWRPAKWKDEETGEEQWCVWDGVRGEGTPVAIVPGGREVAEDICHLKVMARPWWGMADTFVAIEVDSYRETLEIIAENGCEECESAELANQALSRHDGNTKITEMP